MTIKSKHAFILNRLRQMQYTMYYDAPAQKELELAESTIVGLEAEIAELQHNLKNWGTIEIAIRNPAVAESMRHWECRAEKAEAKEKDRQYHMDAINRLANFLGLAGTSYEVVQAAMDNMTRFVKERTMKERPTQDALEMENKELRQRIRQFEFCIGRVAIALGGVCCGGVDVTLQQVQADPHSTTRVLCDAIAALREEGK